MAWLIETCLHWRWLVIALAIALIVVGFRIADTIPLDVFPEFAPPLVEIQTEVPGLSTEDVESLVTVPIESALSGVPFLQTVRSKSVLGLSSVRIIFASGTDLLVARQLIQERLATIVSSLPAVANAPKILPPLSSLSRCLKIGLWSDTVSQMDMTVLTKWTIRPRLMGIPGVANIAVWGERDPQLQVTVNPDRLRAHSITLDAVMQTVREATAVGAGGFMDTPNQRLAIRQVPPVYTPTELGDIVVASRGGSKLRVRDIATVGIGHEPPIGDAIINGRPGLLLIVEKQPWANTLAVTRGVEKAMAELKPALGKVEFDTTIFRPATFIEKALRNLSQSILIGCLLVVVVLVVFLSDWRSALISSIAIPLSLTSAALVLYLRGDSINTMVLAGLVIALGEVVDDAIIDVENILRRLRLNRSLAQPLAVFRVILDASLEVRSSVVFATIIVILAFLPVFFLQGLAGAFFRPLATSYMLAILASLGVALTVTPAMALVLLPVTAEMRPRDSWLIFRLKAGYRALLMQLLKFRIGSISLSVLVGCIFLGSGYWLGEELMPKFKETDFLMHWVEKPGTGIEAMDRITSRVSQELLDIPGVLNFGSHIGRATVADEVVGPNFTELWISIKDDADYQNRVARIQSTVDGYPGLYRDLLTYLTERIKEVLSGNSASIVVRVFGPNLEQLRKTAQDVSARMKSIEGVTTLKVEPQVLVPQVAIKLRPDAAAEFGMTPGALMRAVSVLINGARVGEIYRDQMVFGVVVRGEPRLHSDLNTLRELMVDTPSGAQVPLGTVVDISIVPAPNEIKREGASRRIDISCNVSGKDLGSVAAAIEKGVLADVTFPEGYHPEFLGEYAEARASRRQLLWLSIGSMLGIAAILYADFQSWREVILILVSLPLALSGGIVGVHVAGGIVSLGSLVGFVTLLGIATRNSIMLLSHYRHLQQHEGMASDQTFVIRGAEERLLPILMTASTAALALVPLVVSGNLPGQEIEYPMALVILFGIVTATIVNLFILPLAFSWGK